VFEKILTGVFSVLFIGLMVLAVVFGIVSKSAWVGALAFIGVMLSLGNIVNVSNKEIKTASFYVVHFLGLTFFGLASFLANYDPRWMVVTFISFAMVPLTFASEYYFKKNKTAGLLILLLAVISAPLAVVLPEVIQNLSQGVVVTTSNWAWSLAVGGVTAALIALVRATLAASSDYLISSVVSLFSMVAATLLAKNEAGWLWLIPWLASAISIGAGGFLFPRRKVKTKTGGVFLAVLVLLVGLGFVLMNTGMIPSIFQSAADREDDLETALEKTVIALDDASTKTAAADKAATQAYLEEQESVALGKTQTAQAESEYQAQTSTASALITPTPLPETAFEEENIPSSLRLPVLSQDPGPGFFAAIGQFLWRATKSVWGILYLLLLVGLGQLWVKRWGGLSFFVILLALVGFFGGRQQGMLDLFIELISTGPTTWWTYVISVFHQSSGTIGWGIIGMALCITLLMAPAFLITNRYSQKALSVQRVHELRGTTAAENFLSRNMPGCRESLATWLYLLVSFVFPIALWVALRRLSLGGLEALPFWFIPDLAVPHWKPVWHFAYFVLGAVFFLSYVLYIKLLGQIQKDNPFAKIGLWGALPVSVLLSLFTPAGVVLYQSVQMLLVSILLPLVGRAPEPKPAVPLRPQPQRPEPRRPLPPKPKPKPKPSPTDFEAYLEEMQRLAQQTRAEEEVEEKKPPSQRPKPDVPLLAGKALSILPSPIIDGNLRSRSHLYVMDESGQLFWMVDGKIKETKALDLRNPSHFLTASDGQLLVVTRSGEIIPIKANQDFEVSPKKNIGKRVRACVLNSYGTLLAYTSEDAPSRVHGYFIAAERDQLFFDAGQAPVSCLAFSTNARFLAAGTTSGKILVTDIATHQQVLTIPDNNFGPVDMLAVTEDERWVSVYSDGWVAVWDMNGTQFGPVELSNGATSLGLEAKDDQILIGDRKGYLWAYHRDLKALESSQQVQKGKVTHILTASDGTVLTVGDGRTLRLLS